MSWAEIVGQARVLQQLKRACEQQRLSGSYLFVGPHGVGKFTVALRLAQTLLCETRPAAEFAPCGNCSACAQVLASPEPTHPDLEIVARPADKATIPIDAFIGDREHRSREGLCHRISLSSSRGRGKVAIIDDADEIAQEAANSLLKTLEEPPPQTVIILIASSLQKQLPTIRSRCQVVQFQPLQPAQISSLLLSKGLVEEPALAERLANLCAGSLRTALDLADAALLDYRTEFLTALQDPQWDALALAKNLTRFVETAGKEAPPRRRRMRQIIGVAIAYYRQLARQAAGATLEGDQSLLDAVRQGAQSWTWGPLVAAKCVDACLAADQHVLANANLTTLAECWLDELREAAAGV